MLRCAQPLSLILSMLLLPSVARGAEATLCDELAASPFDFDRLSAPVTDRDLDGERVIEACAAALANDPDNPRLLHQLGRGYLKRSYISNGVDILEKAEQYGSGAAAYELAVFYDKRLGGPRRDVRLADYHYKRGANLGHPLAGYELGKWLEIGQLNGRPDLSGAVKWYRFAAEAGVADAQYRLGLMLSDGRGVKADRNEAIHWLELADKAGNKRAELALAGMRRSKPKSRDPNVDYVTVLRDAAKYGDANAAYNLGVLYAQGEGVPKDDKQAFDWYSKAWKMSEGEHGKAKYAMARAHLEGRGVRKDETNAEMSFRAAAKADPTIRKEALQAAEAIREASRKKAERERYLSAGKRPPIEWNSIVAGIIVFGLILETSDAEINTSSSLPAPYDPCSNPFYAYESPYC